MERKKDSESLNHAVLLTHSWSTLQISLLASKNVCQKIGEIFLPLLRYLFRQKLFSVCTIQNTQLSAFFSENRQKDKHSKHANIYLTPIKVPTGILEEFSAIWHFKRSYCRTILLGIQTAQALLIKILWKRNRQNEIEISWMDLVN